MGKFGMMCLGVFLIRCWGIEVLDGGMLGQEASRRSLPWARAGLWSTSALAPAAGGAEPRRGMTHPSTNSQGMTAWRRGTAVLNPLEMARDGDQLWAGWGR